MKVKEVLYDDYVNYRRPSMLIGCCRCDWKCCRENASCKCQNAPTADNPEVEIDDSVLIERYLGNPLTHAIVFGGLEPMYSQFEEVYSFIEKFREVCDDDVVIFTGYYKNEIQDKVDKLKKFKNIIIKFGRFVPNQNKHYDEIIGIELASDNQYAEKIS